MENQNHNQAEQEEVMSEWDRRAILRAKEIIQNQTDNDLIKRGTNNMLFTWVQATQGIIYNTPEDIWEFLAMNTYFSHMFITFFRNMVEAVEQAVEEIKQEIENETIDKE